MDDHNRKFGVLLPVFSLPSGDMSSAPHFINFLDSAGAAIWQVLPMGPTHEDGSPYLSLSAHAGNVELIGEVSELQTDGSQTQYQDRLNHDLDSEAFARFAAENQNWLSDYSLFGAIRQQQDYEPWYRWPSELRERSPEALVQIKRKLFKQIRFIQWRQFQFAEQWQAVRRQCREANIKLFGDVPLYVAHDSADVWQHQDLFLLDPEGSTNVVAGVPPDYFSATGQRWGNPLYNWNKMAADGYSWWVDRMTTQSRLYDIVRIDHFRGLESYWEIPAESETAENGSWKPGPGKDLLDKLHGALPGIQLVAEDLGTITAAVDSLRRAHHLPGIRVLQFAFDGIDDNPHHPANLEPNTFLYTGTHDNNTSVGWIDEIPDWQRDKVYSELENFQRPFPESLIACAFASQAQVVIIPLQDLLKLDSEHRLNTPGTVQDNWQWRVASSWPADNVITMLQSLKTEFRR